MNRVIVEKNQIYGFLKVVKELKPIKRANNHYRRLILCECTNNDCGNKTKVLLDSLRSGNTKSCGCYVKTTNTKHGFYKHPLYKVLDSMVRRCHDINNKQYEDYGARGIKVCKEWRIEKDGLGIHNFIQWNEKLPEEEQWKPGLEIDRKNNNKGYNPKNCRWVTRVENNSNRRNTIKILYGGKLQAFSVVFAKYGKPGMTWDAARKRYKRGHSLSSILNLPGLID